MSDALLIAAHGSRDPAGIDELWAFASAWQELRPDRLQGVGFLEFARPTIAEAVQSLAEQGARRIVVVPAMLMAAGHVKNDVPSELAEARLRHPGIAFHMARALDIHPALLELCELRFREAVAGKDEVPPSQTLLLLVGRGTRDPDANANIARVSRFLWEAYQVAWAGVAYAGLTAPGVDEALGFCRRMGFARIVVQPYFLFDGVLVKRVRETAARHAALDPATEILVTEHFRMHPLLLQAFEDRAYEALQGAANMNCDVCKYRVRIVGHDADLGQPQLGHHHHVRAFTDDHITGDHNHDMTPRRSRRTRLPGAQERPVFHPWDERLLQLLDLSSG
jgi:sirohydrochlorin ferrochelatase